MRQRTLRCCSPNLYEEYDAFVIPCKSWNGRRLDHRKLCDSRPLHSNMMVENEETAWSKNRNKDPSQSIKLTMEASYEALREGLRRIIPMVTAVKAIFTIAIFLWFIIVGKFREYSCVHGKRVRISFETWACVGRRSALAFPWTSPSEKPF